MALPLPAARASTQMTQEQVYLAKTTVTHWPMELPRGQGERTLTAALDWLDQASECRGADWIAGARHVVEHPDAASLARTINKTPRAVGKMKIEQAVRARRCVSILLSAANLAQDGSAPLQRQRLALYLYLSENAPLLEARSQIIDVALTTLRKTLASSKPADWVQAYARMGTQCFDAHLDYLISKKRLAASHFDSILSLRRLTAEHTLSKRWVVAILSQHEQKIGTPPAALDALIKRLEERDQNAAVLRRIAREAKYIRRHLSAVKQRVKLRRAVTPIVLAYIKAIAHNDRDQLKATSLPLQVKAFGPTPSMLRTLTNNDAATGIEVAAIVGVQRVESSRAKAEVRTIITDATGRAYPSKMTLLLALTDDGWRVGEPEKSTENNSRE